MKKLRVGVFGGARGTSMIDCCKILENADIVAICDKSEKVLARQMRENEGLDISYYRSFEEFIQHDFDAVVLANYANEHAPFAIKALKAGKHVYSEVLPVQNLKEAVELIEAVEESGLVYAFGENCCYMAAPHEMRKLYREGKIGEFEYGECEYVHNCEPIWPEITYGERDHWRNNMFSTFYCTHSLGPIIHMTGLRPVSVVGIEGTKNERNLRSGSRSGQFGIELVTLENGGIVKSIHGGLYKNSTWYSVYGSKGRMESAREDTRSGGNDRIYVNADSYSGEYGEEKIDDYFPKVGSDEKSRDFGHGGSDFYAFSNFVQKVFGDPSADTIDVYEALDMYLPGLLAYRSILSGNVPVKIPNLRNKSERGEYRNDTACTDPKAAGDQLWPTVSTGTPDIGDEVYDVIRQKWLSRSKG